MPIVMNSERQWVLGTDYLTVTHEDLANGVPAEAFKLPVDAIIVGGDVIVDTAFNSATSDTLKVGDGLDDDRYTATAVDLQTLGRTPLDLSGYRYMTPDTVNLLLTSTGGGLSAGSFRVRIEYIAQGRGDENQG